MGGQDDTYITIESIFMRTFKESLQKTDLAGSLSELSHFLPTFPILCLTVAKKAVKNVYHAKFWSKIP